ncbi:MAG: hypothetical protein WDM78_10820 [Puia sp.]
MKKGDPASPFYLFTRSVIYFQWAAVEIKFERTMGCCLGIQKIISDRKGKPG